MHNKPVNPLTWHAKGSANAVQPNEFLSQTQIKEKAKKTKTGRTPRVNQLINQLIKMTETERE